MQHTSPLEKRRKKGDYLYQTDVYLVFAEPFRNHFHILPIKKNSPQEMWFAVNRTNIFLRGNILNRKAYLQAARMKTFSALLSLHSNL